MKNKDRLHYNYNENNLSPVNPLIGLNGFKLKYFRFVHWTLKQYIWTDNYLYLRPYSPDLIPRSSQSQYWMHVMDHCNPNISYLDFYKLYVLDKDLSTCQTPARASRLGVT